MRENHIRDVAIVALRDGRGRILMMRSRRLPEWWQPLGGGIDPDDVDARAALIREVEEETGIVLGSDEIHPIMDVPYDFGEGTIHFFVADRHEPPVLHLKTDEVLEIRWCFMDEARALPSFPATQQFLATLSSMA